MARTTLLLNLHNFAVSQFFNHPASSATYFEGKMLFGTSAGLFESGGDNDGVVDVDGHEVPIPIDAFITLPTSDWGYPSFKALRSLLVLGRIEGEIAVTFTAEDADSSHTYRSGKLSSHSGEKIALSSFQRGRFFTPKIANFNGSDFSIAEASVTFIAGPEMAK